MKLHSLKIIGFKRIKDTEVLFGDATFLIGNNNSGKSTALKAIDYLLSGKNNLPLEEYYSEKNEETGETELVSRSIVFEAEFRNISVEAHEWKGFKGRIFDYDVSGSLSESGLCIFYRKTYDLGQKVRVEMKSKVRAKKEKYEECNTPQDYIDAGLDITLLQEDFEDLTKKISKAQEKLLELINDIWDIGEEEEWFENPGGIQGVVLKKLPRFILIPAESASNEIDTKRGVLTQTLNEIFSDVRSQSENYKQAQIFLNKLSEELDPSDEESDFGVMMKELNGVLQSVFPSSEFHASADLSDPDKALVPSFEIKMSSNVSTAISHQGTGMVRAAVFALLRYRQQWLQQREEAGSRSLIIAFEEPEIYLHPSAANQMRDTIYQLAKGSSQIVASTHSPYIIDLSRKPRQVLNRFTCADKETNVFPFNVTDAFLTLSDNDKDYVKMILKVDDYVARAFFTNRVIVVEGDTEDIVIREAVNNLSDDVRLRVKSNVEVIKARGKAAIIGLVHYLKALGVDVWVIHDRDDGVKGAMVFNDPILKAVGDATKVIILEECIEDLLGYDAPSYDKPYKAYTEVKGWDTWDDMPPSFKGVLERAFSGYLT